MSKYEDRAYNVGRSKPNIAGLKNQLARLKHDLEQFVARKPSGEVVITLKGRIRELEATIAEAEANKKREAQARTAADDSGPDTNPRSSSGVHSISSRFPPRGRPGRG
ncbi:MAG: Gas vesicle protein V [Rhodospirillaceae bacterium]